MTAASPSSCSPRTSSRSRGPAGKAALTTLIDYGVDVVIGTAPSGNILHSKYLLGKSSSSVFSGSYNFSASAAVQDNCSPGVHVGDGVDGVPGARRGGAAVGGRERAAGPDQGVGRGWDGGDIENSRWRRARPEQ